MRTLQSRLEQLIVCEPKELTPENFSLWICCPEAGWIDAKLTIGPQIFFILISDTYPPFQSIIDWLTAIAYNQPVEPISFSDEQTEHYLHVTPTEHPERLKFEYAKFDWDNSGVYKATVINKFDLIYEFYLALSYIMAIDYEYEENRPEGSEIWFSFSPDSDDIIQLDLSELEGYLDKIDQDKIQLE